MNEQRIKLAEAMGWTGIVGTSSVNDYGRYSGLMGVDPSGKGEGFSNGLSVVPDPFTDANDDYAVLEWAKSNLGLNKQVEMRSYLRHSWGYEIGDYARAALKLMDNGGD